MQSRHLRPHLPFTSIAAVVILLGSTAPAQASTESDGSTGQAQRHRAGCVIGTPGSATTDDPYYPARGNGGYDVSGYAIDNTVNTSPRKLVTGTTTISATATQDLSSFNLDFSLTVDSATVNGQPASVSHTGQEVRITPSCGIANGSAFTAVVIYHSAQKPAGWYYETDEILVTGEPEVAQWWFPANDTPRDDATFDVTLRVPSTQQGISVGQLLSTSTSGGRSVWRWRAHEPMAPYLAFMAAGRFNVSSETVAGVRYTYAVSKRLSTSAQSRNMQMLKLTPSIMAEQTQDYGAYPFADLGGLVTSTFTTEDWAMENQTRPTYPSMSDNSAARRLIAHELAHQWAGDRVRLDRWRDIVNNEGMARWAEMRWTERHGGPSANAQLESMWAAQPAGSTFWQRPIDDPGIGHLFDLASYDRGGMMQQALRNRLGEATYLALLRAWNCQYGGHTARVSDFEALAAQISGQDLSTFFHVWLRATQRPAHTIANGFTTNS